MKAKTKNIKDDKGNKAIKNKFKKRKNNTTIKQQTI